MTGCRRSTRICRPPMARSGLRDACVRLRPRAGCACRRPRSCALRARAPARARASAHAPLRTPWQVVVTTTMGDIDVELWPKEAPLACRNFVQLCLEVSRLAPWVRRALATYVLAVARWVVDARLMARAVRARYTAGAC